MAAIDETVSALQALKDSGKIDFLILSSQNIGKIGALQVMLKAAPGEVIAYCDDDVFLLPGWLERHLEVIDTYPNVGIGHWYVYQAAYERRNFSHS